MPRKIRSDKLKNLAKVAEYLIENPHASEREIAKGTWIGNWTAHRNKKELEQTGAKDDTIALIVKGAKKRIEKVWKIFDAIAEDTYKKYYNEDWTRKNGLTIPKEDVKLLKEYVKDDLQRVTVLWGDITDANGWLKDISSILDDIID